MAGEWVERNIGDIADVVGGSTPSTKDPRNFDGDVPWLTPKDLSGPHPRYVSRGERNLSQQGLESCSAQLLPPNSILLSSRAPIGYVAIAANPIATNQGFRSLIVRHGYDHEFLYYWLSANVEELERHASGSTFKELSGTSLKKIRLRLPVELSEQRAIAHILGALDDKIELNRKMAATLEAMARAIFKAWFVDFEPVRAKQDGRDPGLPPHIADLFPDRLVESDEGEIPEGWGFGTLGDLISQRVDRCAPSDETRSRPYVPIECIAPRSLLLPESKPGEEAQSSLTRFRQGDFLFGAMRPYFHKVTIAPFDGITRTTVFVLRPKLELDFSFSLMVLHHPKTIEYATNHSTGSTIPYAVWEGSLEAMPIVIPSPKVRASFDQLVRPFLNRIPSVFFENHALAALRDTLLPKLISGELRVKDAEKFLEGAKM